VRRPEAGSYRGPRGAPFGAAVALGAYPPVEGSAPFISAHSPAVNSKSAARKGLRVQVSSPALGGIVRE